MAILLRDLVSRIEALEKDFFIINETGKEVLFTQKDLEQYAEAVEFILGVALGINMYRKASNLESFKEEEALLEQRFEVIKKMKEKYVKQNSG